MKNIKYIIYAILLALIIGQYSCSKMDDYRDFTNGKEILYTGKVDSVIMRSGENRVVFTGLLISDPKIMKVKIYWNIRTDSLEIPVTRTSGVDSLTYSIPLPEGVYNFEILTFDQEGNSSVVVNAPGASYGETYKQGLYSRLIKTAVKDGSDVVINWYNGSENSPFVEITYIDSDDNEEIVRVATKKETTTLENFKSMTTFKVQTFFLPDETAIDTFKTGFIEYGVDEEVTNFYFENPGNPFLRSDSGAGKWGLPLGWEYTQNVVNQEGDTGGGWSTDGNPSGVLHLESKDWSVAGIDNGKIYQSFELPAGSYTLEFYSDGGWASGSSFIDGNFVVTEGTVPPDSDQMDQCIACYHWDQNSTGGTHKIAFTLDETKTVSVGFVVSIGKEAWTHINWVKMMKLAK